MQTHRLPQFEAIVPREVALRLQDPRTDKKGVLGTSFVLGAPTCDDQNTDSNSKPLPSIPLLAENESPTKRLIDEVSQTLPQLPPLSHELHNHAPAASSKQSARLSKLHELQDHLSARQDELAQLLSKDLPANWIANTPIASILGTDLATSACGTTQDCVSAANNSSNDMDIAPSHDGGFGAGCPRTENKESIYHAYRAAHRSDPDVMEYSQLRLIYASVGVDRTEVVREMMHVCEKYQERLDCVEVAMSYLDRHVLARANGKAADLTNVFLQRKKGTNPSRIAADDTKEQERNKYVYHSYNPNPQHDLLLHSIAALNLAIKLYSPNSADSVSRNWDRQDYDDFESEVLYRHRAHKNTIFDRDGHLLDKEAYHLQYRYDMSLLNLHRYDQFAATARLTKRSPQSSHEENRRLLEYAELNLLDDLDFYLYPATMYAIQDTILDILTKEFELDQAEAEYHHELGMQAETVGGDESFGIGQMMAKYEENVTMLVEYQLKMAQTDDSLVSMPRSTIARAALANAFHLIDDAVRNVRRNGLRRGASSRYEVMGDSLDADRRRERAINEVFRDASQGVVIGADDNAMYELAQESLFAHLQENHKARFRMLPQALLKSSMFGEDRDGFSSPRPQRIEANQTHVMDISPQGVDELREEGEASPSTKMEVKIDIEPPKQGTRANSEDSKVGAADQALNAASAASAARRARAVVSSKKKKRRASGSKDAGNMSNVTNTMLGDTHRSKSQMRSGRSLSFK